MNLMIVESPHKAETIQKFLGDDFKVVSSKGHIRDLQEKELGVDLNNGFTPQYVVPAEKKKTVAELKSLAAKADTVWLASDEDREGEAISWHLCETLGLAPEKTRRITFHEITKTAILEAIEKPRSVDMDLVNAQQARRVLDRLVGYELSPVLWRKIRRGLSAGRVQSVALRLVVDREKEIMAFTPEAFYRVDAEFGAGRSKAKGTLDTRFSDIEQARAFLQDSVGATYTVEGVEKKEGSRFPAPPFTTSTLQQEAGRKLHFSVSQTMRLAQALYERGLITYMRTDSTNLSGLALGAAKQFILEKFGQEYHHARQYKTKSKGAQEAHEAIRPTFLGNSSIQGTPAEQKLYELIWKRTLASQMSEAKILATTVKVGLTGRSEKYSLQSAEILFDGFLKLYMEGTDDEQTEDGVAILPPMQEGDTLSVRSVSATCRFTQPPYRFSEPSLVKKLEELGIGRPSTYAPTISTLTTGRGYLVKGDKAGEAREVTDLVLKGNEISEEQKVEMVGAEKGKLLPSEIGMAVTDYLVDNFADILDYGFTASVENDFDSVAEGKLDWHQCIGNFYEPFHREISTALSDKDFYKVERSLGTDPADGSAYTAKLGQYGPYVQRENAQGKAYASLPAGQLIETISLEEAIKLFALPRTVGQKDGVDVVVHKGRYGPYLKYGEINVSLPRSADPMSISLEKCSALIDESLSKKAAEPAGPILEFGEISVLNGRYGPYIKAAGKNYRIPKGTDPAALTEEACRQIIASSEPTNGGKRNFRKKK